MNASTKAYRVTVNTKFGKVVVICISNPLDSENSCYSLDYYEMQRPQNFPVQSIPNARQATFEEELRALRKAPSIREAHEHGDEQEFIAKQMRDTYKIGAENEPSVFISVIDASMT